METTTNKELVKPQPQRLDFGVNGNYLIARELLEPIDNELSLIDGEISQPISRYPQTTEFQLKNVYFKTENDSFIIRDSSYRLIIPFQSVEMGLITIEKRSVQLFGFINFLCANTGSLGLPFQETLTSAPRA